MDRRIRMNILITGGTGLVGTQLIQSLHVDDDHVYVLTRQKDKENQKNLTYITYNPDTPDDLSFCDALPQEIDAIYNLAGASLQKRWTEDYKKLILSSRVNVTKMLIDAIEVGLLNVNVFVNASAIGYYPPSTSVHFVEKHQFVPHDFLSEVVYAWEKQAKKAEAFGVRVVTARFGLILDKDKGALPMMTLPYRFKVGGKVGSGEQWYSWIHIEDVVNGLLFVFANDDIEGPVNFTAPEPLRQKDFSTYLSSAINQPEFIKTPEFMLKFVLGKMSSLVLDSQFVLPEVLIENDFKFLYPSLDVALEQIYNG